ncbi:MAG: hypothetical protein V1815_01705 [Candidatus Woesearchaeota archaeon]
MKIKEFFKPTVFKIIIAILLIIIIYILFLQIGDCFRPDGGVSCSNPGIDCPQLMPAYVPDYCYYKNSPVFVVLSILILYIISCLIIFVYNKIKKNK